ncbi:hypothetical protein [Chryseobacterium taklimakanense]|nr:hypothetical protein [Chryseobacterium taklimakanense]
MDREIVTELIQNELNTNRLVSELKSILDGSRRGQILNDYQQLRERLGGQGASENAAKIITTKK